eukprot:gnl/Dysnectes_brevis/617_a683_7474.p1 GENE.gnl/Dysnectes_brevis/617_a683_7474~~gnl/Dysnectes_brevis/617_a683_7474.p1  ORF type:complete len:139 (+),score=16.27 gnl/Dysnectes_brevis/617_a683_7474:38-418(+)
MTDDISAFKKQLDEVRSHIINHSRQLEQVEAQAQTNAKALQMRKLTLKVLETDLTASTEMYRPIGKAYALQSRERLLKDISAETAKTEGEMKILKTTHDYVSRKRAEGQQKMQAIIRVLSAEQQSK